jgi:thymidylate kinase
MGTAYLPTPLDRIFYLFFAFLLPVPDVKIFLEVSPSEAYRRIKKNRLEQERFESIEQLEKIGKKVKRLALIHGWIIVDANQEEETIEHSINSVLSIE